MKLLQRTLLIFLGFTAINCQSKTKSDQQPETIAEIAPSELQKYETAYFASGCFWCVEAVFESVKGVKEVISGYSGGKEKNPTYEQVGYGRTTHAEAVEVYYDPTAISFETLVKVFFGSHDPTTLNRQGPDKGAQYRSIAFYKNNSEKKIINDHIAKLVKEKVYSAPIVTEVKPFSVFYDAEDYHQDYEKNNPNDSYIRNVSVPRLKRFQAKFPELIKEGGH